MNKYRLNRRQFLHSSLAAAGMPLLIQATALGKGRAAPSNRIVMGAIGTGGQGTRHIGGGIWIQGGGLLSKPQVQFVAVCDVNAHNRNRARDIVNKYYGNKDCAAYNDLRDFIGRGDIEAVLIATPDQWHVPASVMSIKAGMDVYCEKPLSLTVREARTLADTARRYGAVFQTGTQQRSWYEFRFACELVRNGYIGEVQKITVNVGGTSLWYCDAPTEPEPNWLDWNMWLGPAPWRPYTSAIAPGGWMAYRDYSGGEMTNWGAHMFDIAQWGMGMDNSGPVEVNPPDGRDYKVLTYKYANGTLMVRDKISRPQPGVRFTGTKGWVEVSRQHLIAEPASLLRQKLAPNEIHLYKSKNHQDNFLECIRTRRLTAAQPEIGCRSITVCHIGNIAYWLNRPLKWDPAKERFIGDAEANRMLSRAKRRPWSI